MTDLKNLDLPHAKFPALSREQVYFYYLNSDLVAHFQLDRHPEKVPDYLHWWATYRIAQQGSFVSPPEKDVGTLNLFGFAKGELGLGEDVRQTFKCLQGGPYRASLCSLDYPSKGRNSNTEIEASISQEIGGAVSIFNLPPIDMFRLLYSHGRNTFQGTYNVGWWPWELESWPDQLDFCFDVADEIWGISKFVTDCFQKSGRKPVFHMPLCVEAPSVSDADLLARYSIPKNKFKFLLVFDLNSTITRKNPFAAYQAFKSALGGSDEGLLIVKTMGEPSSELDKRFFAEMAKDKNVILIKDVLERSEINKLIQQSDCYISLHRAEGFGRVMAEAMLLDTNVVATNYSGNLDFMTPENSWLVDYRLVPVEKDHYFFVSSGVSWAEASVESASEKLISVMKDPVAATRKRTLAREKILGEFSQKALKERMIARLNSIVTSVRGSSNEK